MTIPLSFVIPRAAKESQKEKTQAKPPRQFECFIRSMRIKCIENQHKQNTQRPSNPIPTQSEDAVSSIYKQNPLRMAEALEAIIVMLNLIQHLI